MKFRTGRDLVNYLDDFLFIALMKMICNSQIKTFLEVCAAIHFPISPEKTFWATTYIVFLGMLIDTVTQTVSIPVEKIERTIQLLDKILDKKGAKCKVTLKQLQKLCGFLNFLCRSIVPRRAFTRRLYAYTASPKTGKKLLPPHHIRVNNEMRRDMMTWKQFLLKPQAYCHPFIDFSKTLVATEIGMFSDASRSDALGFGAICNSSWMYGMWRWDPELMKKYKPSIAFLELYAVTTGILCWIHRFRNQRIIFFCDNQAAVEMINQNSFNCQFCMILIRMIVLKSMTENVRIFARYIPSKENYFSDLLSRDKLVEFRRSGAHKFDREPMAIPEALWPPSNIFKK